MRRLFDGRGCFVKLSGFERDGGFECECFDEVWIDRQALWRAAAVHLLATFEAFVARNVQVSAGTVWIHSQRVVEERCGVAIGILLGEEFACAEMGLEVIRLGFDC